MPYFVSLNSYQSRKSAVVRISLTTLLSEFYAFRRENITMYRGRLRKQWWLTIGEKFRKFRWKVQGHLTSIFGKHLFGRRFEI